MSAAKSSRKKSRSTASARRAASATQRSASKRHGTPVPKPRKARPGDWVRAARPATLGLSIAPVAVGHGAAVVAQQAYPERTLLALAVAVFLQIGVNYANDFSDGIRGTDAARVGPARLTASGAARPRTVLLVALVFFLLAGIAGVAIAWLTGQWWLIAAGLGAMIAAWGYTGGPFPYGYRGLGEVFVFAFFGLGATLGTMYINAGVLNQEAWFAAVAVGAIAMAVLMINNLRDREQDRAARKFTLTVLIGAVATKVLVVLLLLIVPMAVLWVMSLFYPGVGLGYFALLALIPATVITLFGKTPAELVLALKLAGLGGLLYGLGFAAGYIF